MCFYWIPILYSSDKNLSFFFFFLLNFWNIRIYDVKENNKKISWGKCFGIRILIRSFYHFLYFLNEEKMPVHLPYSIGYTI